MLHLRMKVLDVQLFRHKTVAGPFSVLHLILANMDPCKNRLYSILWYVLTAGKQCLEVGKVSVTNKTYSSRLCFS